MDYIDISFDLDFKKQKEILKEDLDLKHIFILVYIKKVIIPEEINTGQSNQVLIHNEELFYPISYKKVLEDLPFLHIKKTTLAKKIKVLCEKEFIKHLVVRNEKGTHTYVKITNKTIKLLG